MIPFTARKAIWWDLFSSTKAARQAFYSIMTTNSAENLALWMYSWSNAIDRHFWWGPSDLAPITASIQANHTQLFSIVSTRERAELSGILSGVAAEVVLHVVTIHCTHKHVLCTKYTHILWWSSSILTTPHLCAQLLHIDSNNRTGTMVKWHIFHINFM